jgi:D-3-phosphoglycerate dehydrogenase
MRPRVLISDELSKTSVECLEAAGCDVTYQPQLGRTGEVGSVIGGYDGLVVRSATKVSSPLLGHAHRLKVIGRAGIGVDNVDIPSATARGIVVMNTPHGNSVTTAEHTIAMIMALARHIPRADAATRSGVWEKTKFMGTELRGKTLGIVGCGNIGALVAELAIGLKMRVIASDPALNRFRAAALGVESVTLSDLFANADVITLHNQLTQQTRHLINAETLRSARVGVRIVNCARGGLVDEAALADAIRSGHVAGAALDVFETEPAIASPVFGLPGVVCTPHLGASTFEAQERVGTQIAEQVGRFLCSGEIVNAVNSVAVKPVHRGLRAHELPAMAGFIAHLPAA